MAITQTSTGTVNPLDNTSFDRPGAYSAGVSLNGTYQNTIILDTPAVQNPLTLLAGDLVHVANAQGVLGLANFPWTVTNLGTVAIDGTSGSGINLTAGGTVTNGQSGSSSGIITAPGVGIEILGVGAVTNFGVVASPTASGKGISILGGGTVVNAATDGLIAGGYNGIFSGIGSGTIINLGTVSATGTSFNGGPQANDGIFLGAGGLVQNGVAGATVGLINGYHIGVTSGTLGGSATVINFGTIAGTGTHVNDLGNASGPQAGVGVLLASPDPVVQNGAAGFTTALIHGYYHGVGTGYLGAATIVNFGRIENTQTGLPVRYFSAAVVLHNGGTLTNQGLIQSFQNGVVVSAGITVGAPGTITNLGTIRQTGSYVVVNGNTLFPTALVFFGDGTATNTGSISAEWNGVAFLNRPGTIINSGTVESTASGMGPGEIVAEPIILKLGGVVANYSNGLIQGVNSGIVVSGSAGAVQNFGRINVTGPGSRAVTLEAGGSLTNGPGAIINSASGVVLSGSGGLVTNFGTVHASNGAGIKLTGGGSVLNGGGSVPATAVVSSTAGIAIEITGGTGSLNNYGIVAGYGGNAVVLTGVGMVTNHPGAQIRSSLVPVSVQGGIVDNAGTIANLTGSGTAVLLAGTGNLLIIEPGAVFAGAVTGFDPGDTFLFRTVPFGAGSSVVLLPGNVLEVRGNGSVYDLQLDPSDNFNGEVFMPAPASGGGTLVGVQTACFCRGTMILTERGEVPIENLSIGRRVVTASGEMRGIKWIGQRTYGGRFIAGDRDRLPIRVVAGALGDGIPSRDLYLSPEHAFYLDGALVAARLLVNGTTVSQLPEVDEVDYFHIELQSHDIIVAEGALVESYIECDNRAMFHNAANFFALYPDDREPGGTFCAPRLRAGDVELDPIEAALTRRAAALGWRDQRQSPYGRIRRR